MIAWAGADFKCETKIRPFANDGTRECWRQMHLAEPAPVPELVKQVHTISPQHSHAITVAANATAPATGPCVSERGLAGGGGGDAVRWQGKEDDSFWDLFD